MNKATGKAPMQPQDLNESFMSVVESECDMQLGSDVPKDGGDSQPDDASSADENQEPVEGVKDEKEPAPSGPSPTSGSGKKKKETKAQVEER